MRRPITRALATLALASALSATPCVADEDVVGPLPWHVDEGTIFLRRIVEKSTGKPVAGATVKLFYEVPHPEPGFGTPAAIGTSGLDGWVRIRKADLDPKVIDVYGAPSWAYVEAANLRPDASYGEFVASRTGGADFELAPATTLRVALRDPLDRPVVGALVGWLLGCGHTPDVRQARSGADGVAVLERTGELGGFGQIWSVAEGLRGRANYLTDDAWAPWQRPRIAALAWAMNVEGTALTHDGKPAAGVAIGYPSCHRGPWTRTDAEGRFRLVGIEIGVGDDVYVENGEYAVGGSDAPKTGLLSSMRFPAPPPGRRAVIRLPKPTTADEESPKEESDDVRIKVEAEFTGWPPTKEPPEVACVAVREGDGWTAVGGNYDEGLELRVRPGIYSVDVLGRRDGGIVYASARTSVTATAGRVGIVHVTLPPAALEPFDIDWPDKSPYFDAVDLVTDGATTQIEHTDEEERDVERFLPTDRDVFLRVTQGGRTRLTPIDRKTLIPGKRAQVIHVKQFSAVEVRARFVDALGKPASGWLLEPDGVERPESKAAETAKLSVLAGDHLVFVAWPYDETRFQPSFIEVLKAPIEDGKPVDLGAIHFKSRPPSLLVEDASGKPVDEGTVYVSLGERGETLITGAKNAAGRVDDPWGSPGLVVEGATVRAFGVTRRLEGPGPWTFRRPAISLEVRAIDEAGAALPEWTVAIDGDASTTKEPSVKFDQLDAGPHEVVVEAMGRVARRLRFTLKNGEAKAWIAHLRAESPPR